jgi:hypothetical protein
LVDTQLLVATLSHPLGTVTYNADAISADIDDAAGSRIAGGPVTAGASVGPSGFLDTIIVTITAANALAVRTNNSVDGSAVDTGVISTGLAETLNAQSLPANFGVGRGNWTLADLGRVSIQTYKTGTLFTPAAAYNDVWELVPVLTAGNLSWTWKNWSVDAIASIMMIFSFDHSQVV